MKIGRLRPSVICRSMAPVILALTAAPMLPRQAASGQTLDEAVNQQLKTESSKLCFKLKQGRDADDFLTGKLLDFCGGTGRSPAPQSAASGNGQATVATAPGVVQRRLRAGDQSDEEIVIASPAEGASADDAVVDLGEGLSLFASFAYGSLDKDRTKFEDGYDSDVMRFTAGADYLVRPGVVVGLAFDFARQDGDYDGSGDFDTNSYGILGFAAATPTDRTYVEAIGGYLYNSYDRKRRAVYFEGTDALNPTDLQGNVSADYGSDLFHLSIAGAYRQPIGGINVIPSVEVNFSRISYDSYSESGNSGLELRFDEESQTSLISSVGLTVSTVLDTAFAVIVPTAGIAWQHEFANDQRTVDVSFVDDTSHTSFSYRTEEPDRDFATAQAGLTAILPNGLQPFVTIQGLLAHDYYESYSATVGIRYSL